MWFQGVLSIQKIKKVVISEVLTRMEFQVEEILWQDDKIPSIATNQNLVNFINNFKQSIINCQNTGHGILEFSTEKAGQDVTPINLDFGEEKKRSSTLNSITGKSINCKYTNTINYYQKKFKKLFFLDDLDVLPPLIPIYARLLLLLLLIWNDLSFINDTVSF